MTERTAEVDDEGVHLTQRLTGPCEVVLDGTPVWSFMPPGDVDEQTPASVRWPNNMRTYLHGVADVAIRHPEGVLEVGEVRFGNGSGRVRFVDSNGIPIVIDKWGIIQRPFRGRGEAVTQLMLDYVERMIEILDAECGISVWMAFGTLLGAVREGGLISHDSDIDLAFLSDADTPAGVAQEMFRARRALTRHGLNVVNKTASFVTVLFETPDGAQANIDLYASFYVGPLLHETATVRAPVPRDAVLPLQRITFEGRLLPAPADPDTVLQASYGPDWRTPDPRFRHQPGDEIVHRFDDWFGNLMRQRRAWEVYWRDYRDPGPLRRSEFATWVAGRITQPSLVVDVGAGSGRDALHFVEQGHRAVGLDYARGSFQGLDTSSDELIIDRFNLYDGRDTITRAALLVRRRGPRVVYARSLLDALAPSAVDNFWRFVGMLMRPRGSAYLEFGEWPTTRTDQKPTPGGRRYPVDPEEVERRVRQAGGHVVERRRQPVPDTEGTHRWRLAAEWGPRTGS